jgi:multimeric flavodoxin WrbA
VKRLLIVYHTQSGNTDRLTAAVAQGAQAQSTLDVVRKRALETTLDDLLVCDGVVFGSAEYNGYMSGALKDFFDRTFEPAQGRVTDKPYALVVSAGNDGSFAAQYIERIARGYPLKRIAEPIIVVGAVNASALARCEELGALFAAGLDLGIF